MTELSVISTLRAFTLTIEGPIRGKGRHRTTTGADGRPRTYTDPMTRSAEERIRHEWIRQGSVHLGESPLHLRLAVYHHRPRNHWLTDGTLSRAGVREPCCVRLPDGDNVWKLITDALNGLAFRDDRQICSAEFARLWALRGEQERTVIALRELEPT